MNRVKISEFISGISGICCLAIAISLFLPFVKVEIWGYELGKISVFQFLTDSDIKDLISETNYAENFTMAIIIFLVAFSASIVGSANFKTNISMVPPIIMLIAALAGKYMIDEVTDAIFQFDVAKKLIGSRLLTWSYKALLWDSIAAIAVNFYLNYVSVTGSTIANTVNAVSKNTSMGSDGIKCPECGTVNSSANKFCSKCGKPLATVRQQTVQSTWFCSECGCENPENSRFCDKCGSSKN